MKIVNGFDLMKYAQDHHYMLPAFNTTNLEMTYAIAKGLNKAKLPGYIQISSNNLRLSDPEAIVYLTKKALADSDVPIGLHLDHGKSYEDVKACVNAGFTSIMIDASHLPFEENVEKTKELVAICNEKGMSLEAEVGSIGGEEDGVVGMGECADPQECKAIADLGVTMLAAGIGNIHGKYPANWAGLQFDVLDDIQKLTGEMPLVLHGGTGIPEDMIKKAISLGVSKINVNTECQISFAEATRKYIEAGKDLEGKGFDPRKLLAPGAEAIKATVKEKMEIFGSIGKAE